jgi:hypothetical protein
VDWVECAFPAQFFCYSDWLCTRACTLCSAAWELGERARVQQARKNRRKERPHTGVNGQKMHITPSPYPASTHSPSEKRMRAR